MELSRKIDRIDTHGNIREHWTTTGAVTWCGLPIWESQDPAGNAPCRRCERAKRGRKMVRP